MKNRLPVLQTNHVDASICGPCGGKCCKWTPGIASPEDFGAPDREVMAMKVLDALLTGRWSIDWWDGDPRSREERGEEYLSQSEFIRPAMRGSEGDVFHGAYPGAGCTFVTDTGCSLTVESRPRQCRGTTPRYGIEKTCIERREDGTGVTKQDFILAWLPYRDLLREVGNLVDAERNP